MTDTYQGTTQARQVYNGTSVPTASGYPGATSVLSNVVGAYNGNNAGYTIGSSTQGVGSSQVPAGYTHVTNGGFVSSGAGYTGGYTHSGVPTSSYVVHDTYSHGGNYVSGGANYVNGGAKSIAEEIPVESRIEYIPFERTYQEYEEIEKVYTEPVDREIIEWEEVVRNERVPVDKIITDYYAVETQVEYIRREIEETVMVEQQVQKSYDRIQYIPVETQIVHYPERPAKGGEIVSTRYLEGQVVQGTTGYVQGATVTGSRAAGTAKASTVVYQTGYTGGAGYTTTGGAGYTTGGAGYTTGGAGYTTGGAVYTTGAQGGYTTGTQGGYTTGGAVYTTGTQGGYTTGTQGGYTTGGAVYTTGTQGGYTTGTQGGYTTGTQGGYTTGAQGGYTTGTQGGYTTGTQSGYTTGGNGVIYTTDNYTHTGTQLPRIAK